MSILVTHPDRRPCRYGPLPRPVIALAALVLLFVTLGSEARAAAPMVKTQAPAFYRMMLGTFEITALNDGVHGLKMGELLRGADAATIHRELSEAYLEDPVQTSVNAFLINTGTKLVLIDVGFGTLMGPELGHVLTNLRAAGYQPENVDEIYITHLHRDHMGGLTQEGRAIFPKALVRAAKREADFWLDMSNTSRVAGPLQAQFPVAIASLRPYIESGRFSTFAGDVELVPGVRTLATSGHTPGHTCYVIESAGQRMIILGDLIHIAAVQFNDPAVTLSFDTDQRSAAAQRERIFRLAAREGDWIAGTHLSYPGIGHIRALNNGYAWIPVNYIE